MRHDLRYDNKKVFCTLNKFIYLGLCGHFVIIPYVSAEIQPLQMSVKKEKYISNLPVGDETFLSVGVNVDDRDFRMVVLPATVSLSSSLVVSKGLDCRTLEEIFFPSKSKYALKQLHRLAKIFFAALKLRKLKNDHFGKGCRMSKKF